MRVVEIYVHPVKSMRGNAVASSSVEPLGLAGDRRWMVTDEDGRFLTGRQLPGLSRCVATPTAAGLALALGDDVIEVERPDSGPGVEVVVWRDRCRARDAGDAAAGWLERQFGRPLRLVWQDEPRSRPIAEARRIHPADVVSFADGYPLLATTTASLDELNERLEAPVTSRNFRPNVVIDCDRPYAEDDWHTIEIGDVAFRAASACSRCVFTTVDPDTGVKRDDGEPLATLGRYRRDDETRKILFGVNLVPLGAGTIRVGDGVRSR